MEIKFTVDNYPSGPYLPNEFIPWQIANEKTKCSKCGLVLEGVMGYVCSNNDCPIGLGPTISYQTSANY